MNRTDRRRSPGCDHGGFSLVVVGPDGVGKSTLRKSLIGALEPRHEVLSDRNVGPIRRRRAKGAVSDARPLLSHLLSMAKTIYLWIDEVLRWVTIVRPLKKRGGVVISERGWWDLLVFPARYRIRSIPWLHRVLTFMTPLPDLVVVLEAPADLIRRRRAELNRNEIQRQMAAWREVLPARQRRVFVDASQDPDSVLNATKGAVSAALSIQCAMLSDTSPEARDGGP